MSSGALSVGLAACLLSVGEPAAREVVAEVTEIRFHSSFWVNLHVTLYACAVTELPKERRGSRPVARPEVPLAGDLTDEERGAWNAAVAYYVQTLALRDLRTGEGMTAIQAALAASGAELGESPAISAEQRRHLLAAAPVYRAHWWPEHDRAIRAWIADVARRLGEYGPRASARLAALLETRWFTEPVHAEITYYGRAYTTLGPTVSTLAVADPAYAGWAGAEMVFHEVGHALTEPLEARIASDAAELGKEASDLWHVCLFYLAGEVWRSELASRGESYEPYLYKTGLFDRAWKSLRTPIETHLAPYVAGRVDAATAFHGLLEAVSK